MGKKGVVGWEGLVNPTLWEGLVNPTLRPLRVRHNEG